MFIVRSPCYILCESILLQTKPNPSLSGAKRKAPEPPIENAGTVNSFRLKKPREEWSCALCHFRATTESELNEHVQGKRHKANEKELRAQSKHKNSNAPLAEKIRKSSKIIETNGTESTMSDANIQEESPKHNETGSGSVKKRKKRKVGKSKFGESLMQDPESVGELDKINRAEMVQTVETTAELKNEKNFKFWCEICQIGAYNEIVMEDHKKGKRHIELLQSNGSEIEKENAKGVEFRSEDSHHRPDLKPGSGVDSQWSSPSGLSPLAQKNPGKLNKINGAEMVQGVDKTTEAKNVKSCDNTFWCEICQVGFNQATEIEDHKKERDHEEKLLQLKEPCNGFEGTKENANELFKSEELPLQEFQNAEKSTETIRGPDLKPGPGVNSQWSLPSGLSPGGQKNAGKLKEINEAEMVQGGDKTAEVKNTKSSDNTFWHENCQVGLNQDINIEDHKIGKGHKEKLLQLKESCHGFNWEKESVKDQFHSEELLQMKFENAEKSTEIKGAEIVQEVEKTRGTENMKRFKFWCDKCLIGANLEKTMDEHLNGRKHRSLVKKIEDESALKAKNEELQQNSGNAGKSNEKNAAEMVVREVDKAEHKEEYGFWCELCQVGAHNEIVMEDHKKGRKHSLRVKQHQMTLSTPPKQPPLTSHLSCTEVRDDAQVAGPRKPVNQARQ